MSTSYLRWAYCYRSCFVSVVNNEERYALQIIRLHGSLRGLTKADLRF